MATEKKTEQNTVEQRLRALYELQNILSKIDRIKTVRGELPVEVKDLEDEIEGLNARIANFTAEEEELRKRKNAEIEKKSQCEQDIKKYSEQQNEVRNSREYDALSKEIEFQTLEIELAEKHIHEFEQRLRDKAADIERTHKELEDKETNLKEKKSELDEIVSETRVEEENLREKAKAIEPSIDERTLKAFKRIRKNARNGLGIVYVQRNACGGCFNRIPPQRQLEIKMHKKVIVCEYCGRIIIDPELAGITDAQ